MISFTLENAEGQLDRIATQRFLQVPYFDVRDQEEAYRELVERLIHELLREFRPTKRRL